MTYKLPAHVNDSLDKICDIVESETEKNASKPGFNSGLMVGMNLCLTTITEMAYENHPEDSSEQKAILKVGREVLKQMKELFPS